MPEARLIARAAYVALAATDSLLAGRTGVKARRARLVTKPLLMPALATVTTLGTRTAPAPPPALAARTLAAPAFSWGGDLALLRKSQGAFLTGVGSFFAAHVAYLSAFGSARDPHARLNDTGPKVATASWVVTAPVMAFAAGRKDPALGVSVAVYSAALAAMFCASTVLDPELPLSARRRIALGTSLFLLSDSLLGAQEFLRRERSPKLEVAVMATYTAGQWFIADGVSRATQRR